MVKLEILIQSEKLHKVDKEMKVLRSKLLVRPDYWEAYFRQRWYGLIGQRVLPRGMLLCSEVFVEGDGKVHEFTPYG